MYIAYMRKRLRTFIKKCLRSSSIDQAYLSPLHITELPLVMVSQSKFKTTVICQYLLVMSLNDKVSRTSSSSTGYELHHPLSHHDFRRCWCSYLPPLLLDGLPPVPPPVTCSFHLHLQFPSSLSPGPSEELAGCLTGNA
jgi:hypothetical protein